MLHFSLLRFYFYFILALSLYIFQKSPRILWASCISCGMIVTLLAWIAHKLACSIRPTRKASPASCNAKTAVLWSFRFPCCLWIISFTNLWNGTLRIRRSVPFWYFWISFRACIPFCVFLCFSSLIVFNCFLFLSLIHWALFWFSSLNFSNLLILLAPTSLALSIIAFSLVTLIILAISSNGRWF